MRKRSTAGRRSGLRPPQFQLRLSAAPSRLSSPLSALCFALYDTRSLRVNPSAGHEVTSARFPLLVPVDVRAPEQAIREVPTVPACPRRNRARRRGTAVIFPAVPMKLPT